VPAAGCAPARRTRERLIRERPTRERLIPDLRVLAASARFPPVPGRRVRVLAPVSPAGTETRPAPARARVPAWPASAPTPTGRPVLA